MLTVYHTISHSTHHSHPQNVHPVSAHYGTGSRVDDRPLAEGTSRCWHSHRSPRSDSVRLNWSNTTCRLSSASRLPSVHLRRDNRYTDPVHPDASYSVPGFQKFHSELLSGFCINSAQIVTQMAIHVIAISTAVRYLPFFSFKFPSPFSWSCLIYH